MDTHLEITSTGVDTYDEIFGAVGEDDVIKVYVGVQKTLVVNTCLLHARNH